MSVERRARSGADKAERRMGLLAAAFDLMEARPGELASVAEIAARAGVAKGTFYLYFSTREGLYLALLEDQVHSWLDSWAAELAEAGRPHRFSPSGLATSFARMAARRPLLLPLASRAAAVLEPGVSPAAAHRFRLGLARHLETVGARLARVLPGSTPRRATRLLERSWALLLGLWQLRAPPAHPGGLLDEQELASLRASFLEQAEEALATLWKGAAAERGAG